MADVKITRQYQTSELNAQGKAQSIIVVDFSVGDDGPFSVKIPTSEYTAEVARAAVQQLANEIQQIQNF